MLFYVKFLSKLLSFSFNCPFSDIKVVGTPPPPSYGHAMTIEPEAESAYIIGGFDGRIQSCVTKIYLPKDLCSLWNNKDKCLSFLGCSYCAVIEDLGPSSVYCYSNKKGQADR